MTRTLFGAYTKSNGSYPGYINVSRNGDQIVLTVRGDPTTVSGVYICGHDRDKGRLGRCTPGDQHCNNYCNMAPEKGPMQDRPNPCEHVIEAKTVVLSLSLDEWGAVLAALKGGDNG